MAPPIQSRTRTYRCSSPPKALLGARGMWRTIGRRSSTAQARSRLVLQAAEAAPTPATLRLEKQAHRWELHWPGHQALRSI
ncbi:hypothetical protein VTN02DRAFT_2809 [Thermoascus thermophilus]